MFIEVTPYAGESKRMVNVNHIVEVAESTLNEPEARTCIVYHNDLLHVKESYEWVKSYLPKVERNLKIGEAERLDLIKYGEPKKEERPLAHLSDYDLRELYRRSREPLSGITYEQDKHITEEMSIRGIRPYIF